MFSFANRRDDSTDILAIFNDGVADAEVLKRDFVSDRHFLLKSAAELTVIRRHHAQQIGSGNEILDDHDADIVAPVMYQ